MYMFQIVAWVSRDVISSKELKWNVTWNSSLADITFGSFPADLKQRLKTFLFCGCYDIVNFNLSLCTLFHLYNFIDPPVAVLAICYYLGHFKNYVVVVVDDDDNDGDDDRGYNGLQSSDTKCVITVGCTLYVVQI